MAFNVIFPRTTKLSPSPTTKGPRPTMSSLHTRRCHAERASGEAQSLPRALSPPPRPLPEPRVPFGDPCCDRTSSSILLQASGADCASHFRHGLPLKTTLTRLLLFSLLLQPSSFFSRAEVAIPPISRPVSLHFPRTPLLFRQPKAASARPGPPAPPGGCPGGAEPPLPGTPCGQPPPSLPPSLPPSGRLRAGLSTERGSGLHV